MNHKQLLQRHIFRRMVRNVRLDLRKNYDGATWPIPMDALRGMWQAADTCAELQLVTTLRRVNHR